MDAFSTEEQDVIFRLAEALTGTCSNGRERHSVILGNVQRRMQVCGIDRLARYLTFVEQHSGEMADLISALTIHTTSWFREVPHFERLEAHLQKRVTELKGKRIRVLCAACSSGEEVYSFALVYELFRRQHPGFEYEIVGVDIDPVSIRKALKAHYSMTSLSQIPEKFRPLLMRGAGTYDGLFTICPDVRSRCHFATQNLLTLRSTGQERYNAIICRNVLIYFNNDQIAKILKSFTELIAADGVLCLGHSEAIDLTTFGLKSLGNACYTPARSEPHIVTSSKGKSVLVIDDSLAVCKTMKKLLEEGGVQAHIASSANEASAILKSTAVDLITLDLHMPGTSGQEWLKLQRSSGMRLPVVILSGASPQEASEVLGALEDGAQDYIDKSGLQRKREDVLDRLLALIQGYHQHSSALGLNKQEYNGKGLSIRPEVILIGASTGGTTALVQLLQGMPRNSPPIIVTQHITHNFAKAFAERLSQASRLTLCTEPNGAQLEPGHLYMAFNDYHIGIRQVGSEIQCMSSTDGPINRHRPSVDFMFDSALQLRSSNICGILLTGMGADGARGLLRLKEKGAATFAQDQHSCVVFGMPREAIKLGAAHFIGNIGEIRAELDRVMK